MAGWRACEDVDSGNMALFQPSRAYYVRLMNAHGPGSVSTAARLVLGAVAFAAVSGIAFAAWLDHGAAIFMSMVGTGLSWCF